MHPAPLPDGLGVAFRTDAAQANGVSAARLRAADLDAPFRGMRVRKNEADLDASSAWWDAATSDIRAACRHYALVMPREQFFSHTTAAILWGLPVPASALHRCVEQGIDAAVFQPGRTPRGSRIHGHKVLGSHASVRMLDGLAVTSPASTWAALAGTVADMHELVVIGDALVREPMFGVESAPLATMRELALVVAAGRRPGIGLLRDAIPLIRTRAASRQETLVRLLLTSAGLAEPQLNHPVCDESGAIVAWADLAFVRERVAVEFEGDHHRVDQGQWTKDILRQEALERLGWKVVRVTGAQLAAQPGAVLGRVRRALISRAVWDW